MDLQGTVDPNVQLVGAKLTSDLKMTGEQPALLLVMDSRASVVMLAAQSPAKSSTTRATVGAVMLHDGVGVTDAVGEVEGVMEMDALAPHNATTFTVAVTTGIAGLKWL